MLNAAFLTFVDGQLGFLVHDITPVHRFLARRAQLSDRASPHPEHATQSPARSAITGQGLLPTVGHSLPRDLNRAVLPRDLRRVASGQRALTLGKRTSSGSEYS